ncbi:dienelactone hydrolase family protein [Azospirillum sp.]|uniref:dienelactone hydrolase family protein n=1 Tax=Azospirillum sp. TaxID=34012 RepID=UPI003D740A70
MPFAFALRTVAAAAVAASLLASPAGAAAISRTNAIELVTFPSKDADVRAEGATALQGRIMRPAGTGPFPAVVMLHGCSGLFTKAGALSARHLWWARTLRDQGYLVLMVDSFGPRGIAEQCTQTERRVRASVERKRDAWGALDFLRRRPDVQGERIAVVGWSHGGGTVLTAYEAETDGAGFRGGVAFYPGCRVALRDPEWEPGGPLLILIGEDDDWTPAEPCQELAGRDSVKDRLELVVYPGAHHGFDLPASPMRTRKDLANAPGGQAHVGTNEAARDDAVARVTAFLAKLLKEG